MSCSWGGRFSGRRTAKVSLFKIEPDGKYANRIPVELGRASVNTIESAYRVECGRPGDLVGYVGLGRIRQN